MSKLEPILARNADAATTKGKLATPQGVAGSSRRAGDDLLDAPAAVVATAPAAND
jgi:hypothetical protein